MSRLAPKHSDIKIKLVLNIIWAVLTSFYMFCTYTIEAEISGEHLQDHWSIGLT